MVSVSFQVSCTYNCSCFHLSFGFLWAVFLLCVQMTTPFKSHMIKHTLTYKVKDIRRWRKGGNIGKELRIRTSCRSTITTTPMRIYVHSFKSHSINRPQSWAARLLARWTFFLCIVQKAEIHHPPKKMLRKERRQRTRRHVRFVWCSLFSWVYSPLIPRLVEVKGIQNIIKCFLIIVNLANTFMVLRTLVES